MKTVTIKPSAIPHQTIYSLSIHDMYMHVHMYTVLYTEIRLNNIMAIKYYWKLPANSLFQDQGLQHYLQHLLGKSPSDCCHAVQMSRAWASRESMFNTSFVIHVSYNSLVGVVETYCLHMLIGCFCLQKHAPSTAGKKDNLTLSPQIHPENTPQTSQDFPQMSKSLPEHLPEHQTCQATSSSFFVWGGAGAVLGHSVGNLSPSDCWDVWHVWHPYGGDMWS